MMTEFPIKDILSFLSDCKFVGNKEQLISSAIPLDTSDPADAPNALAWLNDKTAESISFTPKVGLLITSEKGYERLKTDTVNFLISPQPRRTFARILELKFAKEKISKTESTAVIASTAKIGKNCYIGHKVVIEDRVTIGDDTRILHGTVIMEGCVIGNSVTIGCNCTIGNYGFGYELNEEGKYEALQHIGNVVIADHVEIGNNTAIDRAVIGSTLIRENAKIDNLVHIAHGADIGANALIIANAMIAGSVKIGNNAWVAPSASVLNKKKVGKNAVVGLSAVVIRDVEDGDVVAGNPAKSIKKKN